MEEIMWCKASGELRRLAGFFAEKAASSGKSWSRCARPAALLLGIEVRDCCAEAFSRRAAPTEASVPRRPGVGATTEQYRRIRALERGGWEG
jgi:hypothetical protein